MLDNGRHLDESPLAVTLLVLLLKQQELPVPQIEADGRISIGSTNIAGAKTIPKLAIDIWFVEERSETLKENFRKFQK